METPRAIFIKYFTITFLVAISYFILVCFTPIWDIVKRGGGGFYWIFSLPVVIFVYTGWILWAVFLLFYKLRYSSFLKNNSISSIKWAAFYGALALTCITIYVLIWITGFGGFDIHP